MATSTERKSLITWFFAYGVVLMTAFYYFLVTSFYINGLHRFSFDQIWFQNTTGAGDFPFSEGSGFFLLFPAMLISGLARFLFPLCAVGAVGLLRTHWRNLSWVGRSLVIALTVLTVGASLIAWSLLGRSISVWVFD